MSNDVNEDLIEATIRRVAEAKAAQQAAGARLEADEEPPPATGTVSDGDDDRREAPVQPAIDEDLIEATIRRVTAEKAARETVDSGTDARPGESGIESAEDGGSEPTAPATAEVDEDLIEATIRRVQAAKTARADDDGPAGDEPAVASEPVEDAIAAAEEAVPVTSPPPPARHEPPGVAAVARADDASQWLELAGRIETRLDETAAAVEIVVTRLDALTSMVQGIASGSAQRAPAAQHHPSAPVNDEDDWEPAPMVPKMPIGVPPRPAILRDPSPMTATAEILEPSATAEAGGNDGEVPQVVDNRPLPKPLPPLRVEQKRGLDLLPRSYRITVEDKRRGVDLVPLHRALLGMDGVKDMSLLSYNNGVAMVSLETVSDIDAESLGRAVSRAMSRDAQVEVHNESTMVVKLGDE